MGSDVQGNAPTSSVTVLLVVKNCYSQTACYACMHICVHITSLMCVHAAVRWPVVMMHHEDT